MDVLYTEHESAKVALASYLETPPAWQMTVMDQAGITDVSTILSCPFCGADVPPIRVSSNPPKYVCLITDGGYYCSTCDERLNEYRCADPARLWEIAPGRSVVR